MARVGSGTRRRSIGLLIVPLLLMTAPAVANAAPGTDPGALVRTTARSTVGVVLDEIPTFMRDRIAESLIARPASFWQERATRQLQLTTYRLVFRVAFYDEPKQQLPLPPLSLWQIQLTGTPVRQTYQGHDVVSVGYAFNSVLLSDAVSPGVSEPRLRTIGGKWVEPFQLPLDPDFVMQRTGFACLDEAEFPFASVDSGEVDQFYDQTCGVEDGLSSEQCHNAKTVTQSCLEALRDHIGRVDVGLAFERIPWDPALADQYRYGEVTGTEPDLQVYKPEFAASRVTYRYIHPGSCELVEHAVGASGWRRLLQFATVDENVGNTDLTIGGVDYALTGQQGELDAHRLFQFSACHRHYHFNYYGTLRWSGSGTVVNSKKGFCLQSTGRTSNRETSRLNNPFADCAFQGIAAGWADKYAIGVPGQWLDTTALPVGPGIRSFRSNPRGFICEGTFVDANGKPIPAGKPVVWAPTSIRAADGKPVEAPLCRLKAGWDANNVDSAAEVIPPFGQGVITEPCTQGEIGPLRNCGFGAQPVVASCSPGARTTITLSTPAGSAPQVVRLTDYSHALKSSIPARWEDNWVPLRPGFSDQPYRLANFIVGSAPRTVTFTCPRPRDGGTVEPGGTYSMYTAPVFPEDAAAPVAIVRVR